MHRLLLVLLIFFCNFESSHAWQTLTENLDLECIQSEKTRLDCDYRLLIPEPPLDIRARSSDTPLRIITSNNFPWPNGKTAILFVIDTSDPARQNVVENNIKHIRTLIQMRGPYHEIGLASFDKELRLESPIGSSNASIISSLQNIRAIGRTTELYRNMLKAISLMRGVQADRKAIYLFSDGQAEDMAYFHNDVVKAARKAGVIINGLGYPRSVSLSVALQTLRRLSEETGGVFIESDIHYNLPNNFLSSPYENIDIGGVFSIDLTEALDLATNIQSKVSIIFETDIGNITAIVPIIVPQSRLTVRVPATPVATAAVQQTSSPEIRYVQAPSQEQEDINLWLWYGIPIALAIIFVIAIIVLVIVFLKKDSRTSIQNVSNQTEFKPYGYLIVQDEKATRYPITNTTWRIGRTKDNELTLADNSVSRRHAEIHRYSNGHFIIFDIDSLNGIYVNDEKIKKKKLEEGDIVEIGDIFLRFTLYSTDYQLDGDTAIQNTRMPKH